MLKKSVIENFHRLQKKGQLNRKPLIWGKNHFCASHTLHYVLSQTLTHLIFTSLRGIALTLEMTETTV